MSFLGVGAGEALLIFILILLLVGPNRFPEVMRQAARWYKIARGFSAEVMKDVRAAVDEIESDVSSESGDLNSIRDLGDLRKELEGTFEDAKRDADAAGQDVEQAARSSTEGLEDEPSSRRRESTNGAGRSGGSGRSSRLLRHTRETLRPAEPSRDRPWKRTATEGEDADGAGESTPPADRSRRSIRPDRSGAPRASGEGEPAIEEEDPFAALEARRAARDAETDESDESNQA